MQRRNHLVLQKEMIMRCLFPSLPVLALAVLGVSSSAAASPITMTQQHAFSVSDTLQTAGPGSTTLQFDQFDVNLGTLTQVMLTLGGPANDFTSFTMSVDTAGAAFFSTVAFFEPGLADFPGFPVPQSFGPRQVGFSCVQCGAVETTTTSGPGVVFTYPQNLVAPFIGSGQLPLTLTLQVTDPLRVWSGFGTWSGDATLTYEYEPGAGTGPTPVPEPASILLLGSGLVAGLVRRRSRR
jgi:PEP-CTERM motif